MADQKLSPHGQALLKALGGSAAQARATPAAVARWGADQPDSVLNVIPKELGELALALPDELFKLSENVLEKSAQVTRQDQRIRIQFWEEYERAHKVADQIDFGNVIAGTGLPTWGVYWEKLKSNQQLLAWLMQPPAHYRLQMKEAHQLGLKRLVDILDLPLMKKDAKGNEVPDTAVALLILQAFKLVDQRLHGAVTQKIVQAHIHETKPEGEPAATNMAEVDRKLEALKKELENPTPVAITGAVPEKQVIEVKSEVVDVPKP